MVAKKKQLEQDCYKVLSDFICYLNETTQLGPDLA